MNKPRKRKNESTNVYNERASKLYYSNGYHIQEIAKRLKISEVKVYNYVTTGNKITTEEERDEMISLHSKGYSYNYIARVMNRSTACVRSRIESPAKVNCNATKELTDAELKKMKDMLENGLSIESIATELGISKGSVRRRLEHSNINNPKHYTCVTPKEVKRFISLYKKGKSYAEIAKICKRSKNTVWRHLRNI